MPGVERDAVESIAESQGNATVEIPAPRSIPSLCVTRFYHGTDFDALNAAHPLPNMSPLNCMLTMFIHGHSEGKTSRGTSGRYVLNATWGKEQMRSRKMNQPWRGGAIHRHQCHHYAIITIRLER